MIYLVGTVTSNRFYPCCCTEMYYTLAHITGPMSSVHSQVQFEDFMGLRGKEFPGICFRESFTRIRQKDSCTCEVANHYNNLHIRTACLYKNNKIHNKRDQLDKRKRQKGQIQSYIPSIERY